MAGNEQNTSGLDGVNTMEQLAKNAKNPMTYLKMGGLMTGGTAIFVALFASTKTGQDFFGTLPMFFSKGIDGKKWNWAEAKKEYLAHKGDNPEEDSNKKTEVEAAQEKAAIAQAEALTAEANAKKKAIENGTTQQPSVEPLTISDISDLNKVKLLMHGDNGQDYTLFAKYDPTSKKLSINDAYVAGAIAQDGKLIKGYADLLPDGKTPVEVANIELKAGTPLSKEAFSQVKTAIG